MGRGDLEGSALLYVLTFALIMLAIFVILFGGLMLAIRHEDESGDGEPAVRASEGRPSLRLVGRHTPRQTGGQQSSTEAAAGAQPKER